MFHLQVKTVSVLTLVCLLQLCSVYGQGDVIIRMRYDEDSTNSDNMYNVIFTSKTFTEFCECMCNNAKYCDATYMTGNSTDVTVDRVLQGKVDNNGRTLMPVYQCRNAQYDKTLNCTLLVYETSCLSLSDEFINVHSFRSNDPVCNSRYCVSLVSSHKEETVTFNNIPSLELCDAASSCPPTTLSSSFTSTTGAAGQDKDSNTTVGSNTSNNNDDDDNTGVIVGVIVTILVVAIVIIGAVWWTRRKKQCRKEPEGLYVNTPTPFGHSNTTSSEDPSSGVHSRPTEYSETSSRDRSLASPGSAPPSAHSQLRMQDSNTSEHVYLRPVTTNPFGNSNNEILTNSTKQSLSASPSNSSAYANVPSSTPKNSSNVPQSTPNDTADYIFIPNSTADDPKKDRTSSGYINQDRNFYVSLVDEPRTGSVYSDADVSYSTVTGDYENRNVSGDRKPEQTGDYENRNVSGDRKPEQTGDYVNRNVSGDSKTEQRVSDVYSN